MVATVSHIVTGGAGYITGVTVCLEEAPSGTRTCPHCQGSTEERKQCRGSFFCQPCNENYAHQITIIIKFPPDKGTFAIEPLAILHQSGDVVQVELLGVVAPPGLVVPLGADQLESDALRLVTPGAVPAPVVIQASQSPF